MALIVRFNISKVGIQQGWLQLSLAVFNQLNTFFQIILFSCLQFTFVWYEILSAPSTCYFIRDRVAKESSNDGIKQGCPTLFLELYHPVGFHSNPNKAHLIQQLEQGCPTLFLEFYHPVGFHSNPNKAHLIQQREQGCPTLFLEFYHPVGFHSNPNKAHLIQQLEQGCPTLFLEIYHPVGFHSNRNKVHLIQQLEQGCPTLSWKCTAL